nr:unnamed protein product [Callosobruchus analis]
MTARTIFACIHKRQLSHNKENPPFNNLN